MIGYIWVLSRVSATLNAGFQFLAQYNVLQLLVTILRVNKSLKIQKISNTKVLKVDFVKNLFTSVGN